MNLPWHHGERVSLRLPAPHLSTSCVVPLPVVSAAFVAMQNVNSEKSVTVDGEKLENGKEKKLGIGMKILFGDDTEYQVQHMPRTLYAHKRSVVYLTASTLEFVLGMPASETVTHVSLPICS